MRGLVGAHALADSVRRKGVGGTARRIDRLWRARHTERARRAADRAFDEEHGVETAGLLRAAQFDTESPNKQFARRYQASDVGACLALLEALPGDPRELTFVDVGCGKGRVLLLASRFPFARIVGLEFVPSLVEVARKNLSTLGERGARIETEVCDATEYVFPDEPLVVYLFNPFTADVLREVVNRLTASLERAPREAYVVLVCPHRLAAVVTEAGFETIRAERHEAMTHGIYAYPRRSA